MENPMLEFSGWWQNISRNYSIQVQEPSVIVSDELYNNLLIVWPIIWLFILPPGVVGNALIIRTFLRMGLEDSVTVSFFALALSDFAHLFLPLSSLVTMPMWFLEAKFSVFFKVQPFAVYFYVSPTAAWFNTLTSLITTFLAVQRCLCIVKPFHFKGMLSRTNTCLIIVGFAIISVIPTIAYVFYGQVVVPVVDHKNRTQYAFFLTHHFTYIQRYLDPVFYVFLAFTVCQTLVLGSVVVMARTLKASVDFRKGASAVGTQPKVDTGHKDGKSDDVDHKDGQAEEERMSSKERTAIVQVALLSTIYVITNVPKIVMALATISMSTFRVGALYHNFYIMGITIRITFDYINSAVNFIVYYKYNTRFRELCFTKRKTCRGT